MSNPALAARNNARGISALGNWLVKKGWVWISFGGLVALIIVSAAVARIAPMPSADAAAVLAAITAAAVGIERIIEVFWTATGLTFGSFWPLKGVQDELNRIVRGLNARLDPLLTEARTAINDLNRDTMWKQEQLEGAMQEITNLRATLIGFRDAAPTKEQFRYITTVADQALGKIEEKYPAFNAATETTKQSIGIAKSILETFKDNPARRLISIYIGAVLGLIVAGLTGLDVIQATLGEAPPGPFPGIGVALTGLLMGLGSNPTHEVIRVLQEIKEGRKAANDRPTTV